MGLPLIHYYPPRHQGYGFAQTPSVPLLGGRNSKASVPKAKTVRWTVFSESVAETLNCEHAAASECEVLALNKPTDGATVMTSHQGYGFARIPSVPPIKEQLK